MNPVHVSYLHKLFELVVVSIMLFITLVIFKSIIAHVFSAVFNFTMHLCACYYSPEVSLCTYNVPHPSKHCINVRIQTKGTAAIDALQQGLEDLSNICDHIMEVFQVCTNYYYPTPLYL